MRLDHPGIARILERRLDEDPPHLVIEHADRGSLRTLLRRGPLSPRNAAHLLRQLAGALAHAHERGVLHLDLKPENILIRSDGTICLADFGCTRVDAAEAVAVSGDLVTREGVSGTAGYVAPERLVDPGAPPTPAADLYAFGVILFGALTGRLPAGLERPGEVVPGLPEAFDRLFEACYVADPVRRARAIAEIEPLLAEAKRRARGARGAGERAHFPKEQERSRGGAAGDARRATEKRRRPRGTALALAAFAILVTASGLLALSLCRSVEGSDPPSDHLGQACRLAHAGNFDGAIACLRRRVIAWETREKRVSCTGGGGLGGLRCGPCDESGAVVCGTCSGKGSYVAGCSECRGAGFTRCNTCSGKGTQRCRSCGDGTELGKCASCGGTGTRGN